MSEVFTASNNITIYRDNRGELTIKTNAGDLLAKHTTKTEEALAEYFQHKHDQENGVWRWPTSSEYIVRKNTENQVEVTNELNGMTWVLSREAVKTEYSNDAYTLVARDYFDAHPKYFPWHDAQPGEVWVVEFIGERKACIVQGLPEGHHLFQGDGRSLIVKNKYITHAERIWPKENNDEF